MNTRKLENNAKAMTAVVTLDVMNIGVIFALFLRNSWHLLLENAAKVIVFPATPILSMFVFILSARQAYLDKKKSSLHNAIANGVAFVGFSIAVGIAFFGSLALGALVPIIFVSTTVVKAVFHAANAVYYFMKSISPQCEPSERHEHRQLAKNHALGFLIGSLIAVAVGCAMIMGVHAYAAFGVAAAVIALVHITNSVVDMVVKAQMKAALTKTKAPSSSEPTLDAAPRDSMNLLKSKKLSPSSSRVSTYEEDFKAQLNKAIRQDEVESLIPSRSFVSGSGNLQAASQPSSVRSASPVGQVHKMFRSSSVSNIASNMPETQALLSDPVDSASVSEEQVLLEGSVDNQPRRVSNT